MSIEQQPSLPPVLRPANPPRRELSELASRFARDVRGEVNGVGGTAELVADDQHLRLLVAGGHHLGEQRSPLAALAYRTVVGLVAWSKEMHSVSGAWCGRAAASWQAAQSASVTP